MSDILTSKSTLEEPSKGQNLFWDPTTGEAYVESYPRGGPDDDPARSRMYSLWIPTGFYFHTTVQFVPGNPANPDSPKVWRPIMPWDSLKQVSAERARDILLSVLPEGATITIETEAARENYVVEPRPLGFVINAFGTTQRRNAGQVARALLHGIYYVDPVGPPTLPPTGIVKFDLDAATQAIVAELKAGAEL